MGDFDDDDVRNLSIIQVTNHICDGRHNNHKTESFYILNKDGHERFKTNGKLEDKSFYDENLKKTLEYLSEPRWMIAINKHE